MHISAAKPLLLASALLLGYAGGAATAGDTAAVDRIFSSKDIAATLVVASLDGDTVHVHNPPRSSLRLSPASTFKVANTLIALDRGIVTSADSAFAWDGNDRGVPQWNRDQTLESAFKVSCVWCYQEIARKVGAAHYATALAQIGYGNGNIGERVDSFWLNGDLAISAAEQIEFLRKLYLYQLPFAQEHVDVLKEIMRAEETESYSVFAKTGWTGAELGVGWYVGFVTTAGETWLFAMNMQMNDAAQAPLRRELTMQSLRALSII